MGLGRNNPWLLAGIATLTALLVLNLPLFVCMPLAPDVNLYDFCARNVLRGGVHYRDVFENNFPGIVWLHAGIRTLVGWRTEALRAVDLLIVCGVVLSLVRWLRILGQPGSIQVWAAVALCAFYLSTSEWCHCQRDTWMLLPAMIGLHLRRRQVARTPAARRSSLFWWSFLEGTLWAAAFWIKPFVAVPALAAWLTSALVQRQRGAHSSALLADFMGLLLGGMIVGALGTLWLRTTGAWPYFWDVFLHWNAEYYAYGRSRSASSGLVRDLLLSSMPWVLVHLLAVPAALITLGRGLFAARSTDTTRYPQDLMAAFYLGWLGQAVFLQNLAHYIYVPPLLLAITLLAGLPLPRRTPGWGWLVVMGFAGVAIAVHPAIRWSRTSLWVRCFQEGSTPQIKNRLALLRVTDWVALDQVREYLWEQAVGDGELVVFSAYALPLYLELDVGPPMRFVYFDVHYNQYIRHRTEIRDILLATNPRFIVSDLDSGSLFSTWPHVAKPGPVPLPEDFPAEHRNEYPWSLPIVFRAGRYAVHSMRQNTALR
jgi:hypothetical protein